MTNDFKNKQSSGARPPRLSPEEYAAKKKAEKEAVYQLLDNTASEVVQSPEKFKAYLDVQSRMDRYTANNALLMYKQFPQTSQIKEWLTVLYLMFCSLFYFVVLIINRVGKTVSLLIGVGVCSLILLVIALFQFVFPDELVSKTGEFMMKAMGFMSDGTINLFFPILSFLVIGMIFGIGSYAVIRRTELR